MRSFAVEKDRLDLDAATELVAAQQVRGHVLNPYTNARADKVAIQKRIARSLDRARELASVVDEDGQLRAFATLEEHQLSDDDINCFFIGTNGLHSTEFAVPSQDAPDSDGIVRTMVESIYQLDPAFVSIELPIGAAWSEHLILRAGFQTSGVESIRQPYTIVRNTRPLPDQVRLREASEGDLEAILNLMMEEWTYLTRFHCVASVIWNEGVGKVALREHLQRALVPSTQTRLILAEQGSNVMGMIHLRLCEIADSTNPLPYGTHVMIEDISVQSGLRGQGIGRALVQATYDAYRDEKIAGYGVSYVSDNPIARRLWPHLGFRAHKRSYVRNT